MSLAETRLAEWRARLAADPTKIELRLEVAYNLIFTKHYEEATSEMVWLWQHLPRDAEGKRIQHHLVTGQIRKLIEHHPPARAVFTQLRDRVEPQHDFFEWGALNHLLGDEERIVAWFDSTYKALPEKPANADAIEQALVRPLVERGRWAEAGQLMRKPVEWIGKILPPPSAREPGDLEVPKEMEERISALGRRGRCMFAAIFVRALLAADRQDDARAVAEYCRSVDQSVEMDQVLMELGVPRSS